MDLLEQGTQNKKESKGKKIVLTLLIISIVLLISLLIAIFLLKQEKTNILTMKVNDIDTTIKEGMLISDEAGKKYISIEEIAPLTEYGYLRGGYLEYVEDNNKGYIENSEGQIIGFEANKKIVYKTTKDSYTDYEYYELKNSIIKLNNKLYIALEDLNVGCNLSYFYNESYNTINIKTPNYIIELYEEEIKNEDQEIELSYEINSKKAIAYNMIIATNKSKRMGVLDLNLKPIIGYKYSTINYNESSQNFIVSNDNKYGVLSKEGEILVNLKYEDLKPINYSPLLYQVKLNDKYGIIDEEGKIIVNLEYDEIGYFTNSKQEKPLIIIKNLNNDQDGLIVCKDKKYGIVDLKTGETIVNCDLDKIYYKDNEYYIELLETEIRLSMYIEYINTTTVVTN